MFSKRSWMLILVGITLFLVSLYGLSFPSQVLAQCGGEQPQASSSCLNCHEVQAPINDKGEWHSIHAGQDLCLNCHGGNGTTADKALAHGGMVANPLDDIYTDCHSCHPNDYATRADRFGAELGVTVGSCATPTTITAAPVRYQPVVIQPTPTAGAPATSFLPSLFGGIGLAVIGAIILGLMLRRV